MMTLKNLNLLTQINQAALLLQNFLRRKKRKENKLNSLNLKEVERVDFE